MSLVAQILLQEMMDRKECMTECNEYKKLASTGNITKKCQACPTYSVVFKRAIGKLQEEIETSKK